MKVPGIKFVQGLNDYDDADDKHFAFAIHNTSNDASDEGEAAYATRRPDGISSHFYADDDSVTQSLDTNDKAGHAGSKEGNENAIAWEFTGANGKSRDWWLANINWDEVARVMAYIIKNDPDYKGFQVRRASVAEMKSNPKVMAFYGHDDMRRAWGGTTHTDPGPNFPWDKLLSSVTQALGGAMTALETFQAVWKQDLVRNPYGDKETNPTIQAETALFNIGGQTETTMKDVALLHTKVDELTTKVNKALVDLGIIKTVLESDAPVEVEIDYDRLARETALKVVAMLGNLKFEPKVEGDGGSDTE